MPVLTIIITNLAILAGLTATLFSVGFMLAGAANLKGEGLASGVHHRTPTSGIRRT